MLDLKEINKLDPIVRTVDKGLEEKESSPMDPPSAYEGKKENIIKPEDHHETIRILMREHQAILEVVERFETALLRFRLNGYALNPEINLAFADFFKHFDEKLLAHNTKEEKILFPLLHARLIESGEHSTSENPATAIDIMEDDHIKFIQLAALTFNLLGLATRLIDDRSRTFVFDTAYENGRELIEMIKLHIYREDHTLFPLAYKLIAPEEFEKMLLGMKK